MDLFVSCFWGNDKRRIKLCKEFVDRYPRVHLLQNGKNIKTDNCTYFNIPNVGFVDYLMINSYIDSIGVNNINSLTLIDSDLILTPCFFDKIIEGHSNISVPNFLTYRKNVQLINDKMLHGCNSKIYNVINKISTEGHCGFILSFNKAFLQNYRFNEDFIHGGFDWFITNAILGKCIKQFQEEFKKVPKTLYSYIDSVVFHQNHGMSKPTPWELYKRIIN